MTTERWNDKMLDQLAETVEQTTHNIDMLVGAVNALLERDRERAEEIQQYKLESEQYKLESEQYKRENEQYKRENEQYKRENEQYKRENDRRFNVLLEEVRFLIRQLGENR